MKIIRDAFLLLFAITVFIGTSFAQSSALDAKAKSDVVNRIASLLKDNYVFPDAGERAGKLIQTQLAQGAYSALKTQDEFSDKLTEDLQSVTHDKHMRVFAAAPENHSAQYSDGEGGEEHRLRHDAANNFAFTKVERMTGNVGYLELIGFASAEKGEATAVAAMNYVANCDAVIIDLRRNHGGEPSMIQLISSYFFKERTHLNDLYWRKGNRTEEYWTREQVPGKRMAETPVFVLTSARSFSAAEEFANNLKALKRARIIGETTGGGANPGDFFPIAAGLSMFLPTGRAINPITKTNWEGTGVEPDEKVPARDALNVAYKEALEMIAAKSSDPQQKVDITWALSGLEAKLRPVNLPPDALQNLAGDYGARRVSAENGALYLQMGDRPRMKLVPLASNTFAVEGMDAPRLRFAIGNSGKARSLTEIFPEGHEHEFTRN
jgi:retinol-binding protein 3